MVTTNGSEAEIREFIEPDLSSTATMDRSMEQARCLFRTVRVFISERKGVTQGRWEVISEPVLETPWITSAS